MPIARPCPLPTPPPQTLTRKLLSSRTLCIYHWLFVLISSLSIISKSQREGYSNEPLNIKMMFGVRVSKSILENLVNNIHVKHSKGSISLIRCQFAEKIWSLSLRDLFLFLSENGERAVKYHPVEDLLNDSIIWKKWHICWKFLLDMVLI